MTSAKTVSTALKSWIESKVRIDSWDLDIPRNEPRRIDGTLYAANCAIAHPFTNFTMERYGNGTSALNAIATFPFSILYRFAGSADMHQLPIGSIQTVVEYLSAQALQGIRIVDPAGVIEADAIKFTQIEPTEDPIKVGRTEGEDSDWILAANIRIQVKWKSDVDPEDLENIQPIEPESEIEISGLNFGINRSLPPVTQEPGTFVKDRDLVLEVRD